MPYPRSFVITSMPMFSVGKHISLRLVDIQGSLMSSDAQADLTLIRGFSDCQIIITGTKKCDIMTFLID